ncbi:MAG TPA: DUF1566 domain-containing protein [Burkholderiaceae bacterium]|nr:DUF1566 domain-containing protein [Burkholderiaceae bacterium]
MAEKSKHLQTQPVDTATKDYVDLWALAFEYRSSLERLLGLNKELNTYLTSSSDDSSVDFNAAIEKFKLPLEAASAFLVRLDALSDTHLPHQLDLLKYGQHLVLEMRTDTVALFIDKFNQFEQDLLPQLSQEASAQLMASVLAQEAQWRQRALDQAGYIDHGDGTITDTRYKLMWMKCAQGQEGPLCEGAVLTFTWEGAMSIPLALNQQGGFAGYTDWRVPTASELESLLQNDAEQIICKAAFPNAPEIIFWSSTTIEGVNSSGAKDAWNVYFGTGSRGLNDHNNLFAVRLVRNV